MLAGVGTFMLAISAVTLVGARWDRFVPSERLGILLVASVVAYLLTIALRKIAPFTSRSLDVLVAALMPVDIAALLIAGGADWPVVLLAAGPAAIASAEFLRRKDPMIFTELGTITGGVLLMAGVAATVGTALPTAVGVAGLGLLAILSSPFGRDRLFGPAWAALAGLAPALRILDDVAFMGQGTLRDIGLLDAATTTSTLIAGGLAFTGLAIAAYRRTSTLAALAALGVLAATGIDAWARFDPPNSALLIAIAIAVVAGELLLSHRSFQAIPDYRHNISLAVGTINALITTTAIAAAFEFYLPDGRIATSDWKYTAAICAVGWLIGDLRRGVEKGQDPLNMALVGGNWDPALPGFFAAVLAAVQLTFVNHELSGLVAIVLASLSILTLRPGRLLTAWSLAIVAPMLVVQTWQLGVPVALAGAILVMMVAHFTRLIGEKELANQAGLAMIIPAICGMISLWDTNLILAGGFFAATLWIVPLISIGSLPTMTFALRVGGLVGLVPILAVSNRWGAVAAAALCVAAAYESYRMNDSRYRILAIGLAPIAIALTLASQGFDTQLNVGLTLAIFGLGLIADGYYRSSTTQIGVGVPVVLLGWFQALLALDVSSAEPYLYPILLAIGVFLHRTEDNPWVVVTPPLLLAIATSGFQRFESGHSGHMIALGAVTVLLTVWGAVRNQRAALTLGAATTVAIAAYEALDNSVGIESWGWLVVSGSAILTVAALLESNSEPQVDASS